MAIQSTPGQLVKERGGLGQNRPVSRAVEELNRRMLRAREVLGKLVVAPGQASGKA